MTIAEQFLLIEIIPLFALSAFFSGAEVALFSLDKNAINQQFRNRLFQRYLTQLLEHPRRLLITILIGNTVVNTLAAIVSAMFAVSIAHDHHFSEEIALSIQIVTLTLTLLVFGEVSPKVLSSRKPVFVAKIVTIPLYWISACLYPVTELLLEIVKPLSDKFRIKQIGGALTTDELQHLAEVGKEKGTLDEDEHDLIRSVVESKTTVVREIMIHRTDVTALAIDSTQEDVLEVVRNRSHNRIPVYKESLDEIAGVLYVKDLLPFLQKQGKIKFDLHKIIKQPLIVPETKLINDMMREFQEKKMHLAIVVDEHGGTSGIVTLEDIIQEVVGDLRDELTETEQYMKKVADNTYLVDGTMPVEEYFEFFHLELPIDEITYDTVAGWVFNITGVIPKKGYTFHYQELKIIVVDSVNNRIRRILVEKKS
ncbi:MAG: hemolysin family protein [Ignavibacteria bacterium]|nr:hemolysin family protein [Ignavibacteria bacterium]